MADLSPEQMEEMAATMRLPPEQRSIGQVGSLMDLVAGQQFFQSLSYKLAQQVCRHLRPEQVEAGDFVFQEGDDGWEFYVLLRGTAEVIINGTVVATMGVGTTFGELALIDGDGGNSKRTASIRCATDCFLGVVGKDVYNRLIKKEQEAALSLVIDFYSRNQYLQEMRADTILHMAHVSQSKRWTKGDTMMATGEAVDGLLFLKSGQCMISKEVFLAPDSAIRGSTAASLSNSGHPGLRQDLKKISVDISLVCGYGDVVGESELLTEVLSELASSGAESRKRGAGDKGDKDKGESNLSRVFTITAVTDVEAFHVKPRDAKRFIARSAAARQALMRNQARRDTIFDQRMGQWEAAREMQHGSRAGDNPAAAGSGAVAGGSDVKPIGRAVLAPFPESSALQRARSGRGGGIGGEGQQI
jgi:CRP-like cAMP-binding protein